MAKKIGIFIDRFSNFQVFNLKAPTQNNVGNTREDINEDEVLEIKYSTDRYEKISVGSHNIVLMDITFDICSM